LLEELDSTTTASQAQDIIPIPGDMVPIPGDMVPVPGDMVPVPGDMVPVPGDMVPVPGDMVPVPGEAIADQAKSGRSGLYLLREVVETILLTLVIFIVINALTGRFRIEGPSMKPTLHEGQYLIISKLVYKLHPPQRGDIIVFHHPQDPARDLIKRIIGLPGEEVEIRDSRVYVNGVRLEEPYVTNWGGRSSHQELGPDEYFVLGDNRPNSDDSRSWGGLAREMIVGKAWMAYWPPGDWGLVSHYSYAKDAAAPGRVRASDDQSRRSEPASARQEEIMPRTRSILASK
jgi:signal peptidase I